MIPSHSIKRALSTQLTRKLLWLMILATLAIVTIIIVPHIPTPRPAVDSKLLALRVLLGVTFCAALLHWNRLREQPWTLSDSLYAALIIAFSCSTLFSGRILYSLSASWQQGGLLVLSWLVYRIRPKSGELRALIWIVGTLTILASAYGFLTYIGHDILRPFFPFEFEENQGGRNFIHSFFGNPEYYAGYAAPGATVLIGLALRGRSRLLIRSTWLASVVFVLLVLALSGSRSAFFGFVAGGAIVLAGRYTTLNKKLRRLTLVALSAATFLVALLVVILSTPNPINQRDMRLLQRFTQVFNAQSVSVRERIIFYTSTATAIPHNPVFGYGPGTFRLEFLNNIKQTFSQESPGIKTIMLNEMNTRLAEHAHNDYLETWFDQGTLGFGIFLLLLLHLVVRFISTRKKLRANRTLLMYSAADYHLALFAAIITICLNAFTSFPFQMPARATLAWTLIGAFLAADRSLVEALTHRSGIPDEASIPPKVENT